MAEVPKPSETASEMLSSHGNGEGDKEVLAPSEGPREDLIQTAIKFLQNPRVRTSPLAQKKVFLEKKGLSQQEIDMAVERSGVAEGSHLSPPVPGVGQGTYPAPTPNYRVPETGMQVLPSHLAIPRQSRWAQARDLALTSVMVAGVSYAVYHVIQTYLRPLIWGKSEHESRIERLESQVAQINTSVSESLAEMGKTLVAIQSSINNRESQPPTGSVEVRGIADLKSDIASLKGLLLSRNQFPPAPNTSPMLPSWQRSGASPTTLTPVLPVNASPPPSQDSHRTVTADLSQSTANGKMTASNESEETGVADDLGGVDPTTLDTNSTQVDKSNLDCQD